MPHQKEIELSFLSSGVLTIIGGAMLVGLMIAEQFGKLRRNEAEPTAVAEETV